MEPKKGYSASKDIGPIVQVAPGIPTGLTGVCIAITESQRCFSRSVFDSHGIGRLNGWRLATPPLAQPARSFFDWCAKRISRKKRKNTEKAQKRAQVCEAGAIV